jgi:uncharacterized protein YacL
MSLLGFCQWLEDTSLSSAIRESAWGFPIIETVHVLGLCLFGMAILVDLRLLDVALKRVPVSEVTTGLSPWVTAGIVAMMASGVLTFLNAPVDYYNNTLFRIKLIMLLLIGANAWLFRSGVGRRAAVTLSLILWTGVVVAGRLTAYRLFDSP